MKDIVSVLLPGFKMVLSVAAIRLGWRIPVYCEWEVTDRCTMKCRFCGTRKPISISEGETEETSTKEALTIIDQLSAAGCGMIHFSGGEPTLRNDLGVLVGQARDRGMLVAVTTNGSASADRMKDLLKANIIQVSVDGPERFHDENRGCTGAFKQAWNTVCFLKTSGKQPVVTSVFLENSSYKMLQELAGMARSIGVQISLKNRGRNVNEPPERTDLTWNNLNSPYYSEFVRTVGKLRRTFGSTIRSPHLLFAVIQAGGLGDYGCRAADSAISIKADGRVSLPCNGLSRWLLKGKLQEIYYGREAEDAMVVQGIHALCRGCTIPCMVQASALLRWQGLAALWKAYRRSLFPGG